MTNAYRGRGRRAYERQREALLQRTKANGGTCTNCGQAFDWDNPNGPQGFTADHPTAINNGGSLLGQQLVPLCRSCNARKGDVAKPILRPPS